MLTREQLDLYGKGEAGRNGALRNISQHPEFKKFLSKFFSGDSKKIYDLIVNTDGKRTSSKGVFGSDYFDSKDLLKSYHSLLATYQHSGLIKHKRELLLERHDELPHIYKEYGQERTIEATTRFLSQALKGMIADCQRGVGKINEHEMKERHQAWLRNHKIF